MMENNDKRALIAMSGGVDSSVAAFLMLKNGYTCVGATMKLFNNEEAGVPYESTCCSLSDISDARSTAFKMGIPYYVFNFTEDFKPCVIDRFINGYSSGMTPNPCIDCNRFIKFSRFLERADVLSCRYISTGHYARVVSENGRYLLKKAKDSSKDQSYMLWFLKQKQLSRIILPLGEITKKDTREIAAQQGFVNAEKPDSEDICFVPDGNYASAIERLSGKKFPKGDFLDKNGRILGCHNGIINYTIGQRRGLGLGSDKARYVCSIDPVKNTVTLGDKEDLTVRTVDVSDVSFTFYESSPRSIRAGVSLRYRQKEVHATIYPDGKGNAHIEFDTPQRASAGGQSAVFYDGETVVGGGIINKIQLW
jgi:tRNA-specific 2-thiouridylase